MLFFSPIFNSYIDRDYMFAKSQFSFRLKHLLFYQKGGKKRKQLHFILHRKWLIEWIRSEISIFTLQVIMDWFPSIPPIQSRTLLYRYPEGNETKVKEESNVFFIITTWLSRTAIPVEISQLMYTCQKQLAQQILLGSTLLHGQIWHKMVGKIVLWKWTLPVKIIRYIHS